MEQKKTYIIMSRKLFGWYAELLGISKSKIRAIQSDIENERYVSKNRLGYSIDTGSKKEFIKSSNPNMLMRKYKLYKDIPKSSIELSKKLNSILEHLSLLKKDSEEYKKYLSYIDKILRTVINLNLIEEESENYLLQFNRINLVLSIALDTMLQDGFDLHRIAEFNEFIDNPSYEKFLKLYAQYPLLTSILALATNNNEDSRDYEIFKKFLGESTESIDKEKLHDMIIDYYSKKSVESKKILPNNQLESPKKTIIFEYVSPLNKKDFRELPSPDENGIINLPRISYSRVRKVRRRNY